jgi:hypothetical protein
MVRKLFAFSALLESKYSALMLRRWLRPSTNLEYLVAALAALGHIGMFGIKTFRRLLEPGHPGSLCTRNRILKTGSTLVFFPWEDGHIPQKLTDSYEALAKGGAGIVTVGAAPLGVPLGRDYSMDDDKFLPSMTRLAETIRKYDCSAFMQMFRICSESRNGT